MTREMIAPLLFGIVGVAILLNLGAWQLRRLEWKNDMIATIEARMHEPPVSVPAHPEPDQDRFRHIRSSGEIRPGELHVYTSVPPYGVGYRIVVPFELQNGRVILLDRGFVPIEEKDKARHLGPIMIEGALQWPRETDRFTAEPDLDANIWFARDVPLMAETLQTEPVLLVTEASDDPGQPMPLPVAVNIRNNHLEYAITWFSLAFVWAVMTLYLLSRIKRRTE
ncbi:MAG: SURF1 family protein [Pseudomonadota bacterium]